MPQYFVYLISSLPMLHLGMKPPFSFRKFLEICQPHISAGDFEALNSLSGGGGYSGGENKNNTLKQWHSFEATLRNELVRIRSQRLHLDPDKFLRPDADADPAIARIAIAAYRNPSLLEAERMLDAERWRKLEELALGHYFDLDVLIIYGYQLLILERWQRIDSAEKAKLLAEVLS